MDIGDPSCFPLLTRNCVMEDSLVRYRSIREGLRTRILLRECGAAERACEARRQPQHWTLQRVARNFLVPGRILRPTS